AHRKASIGLSRNGGSPIDAITIGAMEARHIEPPRPIGFPDASYRLGLAGPYPYGADIGDGIVLIVMTARGVRDPKSIAPQAQSAKGGTRPIVHGTSRRCHDRIGIGAGPPTRHKVHRGSGT